MRSRYDDKRIRPCSGRYGDRTDQRHPPDAGRSIRSPGPNAIFHVEISQLPGAEELEEGQQVYLQNEMGQSFPVTVVAKEAGIITFDANHEMAGKELNFQD